MTRYALVIGVSEYSSSYLDKLPKAATDAEEVAKVLATYGDFQVERLPKKWNKEAEKWEVAKAKPVTKKEVIRELRQLLWKRGAKSEVLIYFAGHGIRVFDELDEPQGFLAVSDCEVQLKEDKVVGQTNGIGLNIINRLITDKKCDISRLVMMLDSCHSGSLLENQEIRKTLTVFGSENDYYLIAGCRSFENARAFKGETNSIFTGALLKGLSVESSNHNGEITVDLVFNVIDSELKDSGQEPIRIGGGRSITLVKYSQHEVQTNRQNQNTTRNISKDEPTKLIEILFDEPTKLIEILFDALCNPNIDEAIKTFEEIAHKSLFINGEVEPNFLKNNFQPARENAKKYQQPIKINGIKNTERTRIGSKYEREYGTEKDYAIARNYNLKEINGHIRIFFPENSAEPSISNVIL